MKCVFVKSEYMCVHFVSDRETLEKKPLILPTDSQTLQVQLGFRNSI